VLGQRQARRCHDRGAALAAYGIKAEVENAGRGFHVIASGGDAVKLASLYFLFGLHLLEVEQNS